MITEIDSPASSDSLIPQVAVFTVRTTDEQAFTGWPDSETAVGFMAQALHLAQKQFARVALYTDSQGKELLKELAFDEVIVSLDNFDITSAIRGAAKLSTLAKQREPFVHMDWDFILWEKRSERVAHPLVAQSRSRDLGKTRSHLIWRSLPWKPQFIDAMLEECCALDVPCPALVGGTDADFFQWYAELALEVLRHPKNQFIQQLAQGGLAEDICVAVEQWLLGACAQHLGRRFQYLADEPTHQVNSVDPNQRARLGFTHLAGRAKHSDFWKCEIQKRNADAKLVVSPAFFPRRQMSSEIIDLDAIPYKVLVSLEKHVERRQNAQRQFQRLGWEVEWKEPVKIGDLTWGPHNEGYRSRPSSASHAATVLQLLEEAERKGVESLMLFEDDVILHEDFSLLFSQIRVPNDWRFLYLGGRNCGTAKFISRGLVRSDCISDLHAIVLRAEAIPAVKRVLMDPCIHSVWLDFRIATLHHKIPAYLCRPNLAWQAPHTNDSGSEDAYCNYHPDGTVKFGQGD